MAEITLRAPLGRPLTYQEVDDNFKSVQELTLLAQQFALTAQEASTLADEAKNEAIAAKDEALVASGSAASDAQRAEDAADRAEAIAGFDGLHNTLAGRNEPGAHDASAIGYKLGAVERNVAEKFGEFVSVKDSGAVGDGITDDTDSLIYAFSKGGNIYVPKGDYLIAYRGPDSGGVLVQLTKNTHIICSPEARFFTDSVSGVDNDLIRFYAPSLGFSYDPVDFKWEGGVIDQRNQKNSTTMPFTTNYPPKNPGSSGTTDGLSVVGVYSVGGVNKMGIRNCTLSNVKFVATDHKWESAGGDSGFHVSAKTVVVHGCYFKGSRDLGIYLSGDNQGRGLVEGFHVSGCTFVDCMFGVSSKRAANNVTITNNSFMRCIRSIAVEAVIDAIANNVIVTNNTTDGYIFGINLAATRNAVVTGNTLANAGVLLEDGSTPVINFTALEAIKLRGVAHSVVANNVTYGKISEFSEKKSTGVILEGFSLNGRVINTDYVLVTNNVIKDIDYGFNVELNLSNVIFNNHLFNTKNDKFSIGNPLDVLKKGPVLRISNGSITAINSYHTIDTEENSATDILETIHGGVDGMRLLLRSQSSTRKITLKDGTGNMALAGDFSLNQIHNAIELVYDSKAEYWFEISRSDNLL